jgi:hypothetical protein
MAADGSAHMCLCPVGWDHDLGGVFSGRAMREASEKHLETQLKTARDKVAHLYAAAVPTLVT